MCIQIGNTSAQVTSISIARSCRSEAHFEAGERRKRYRNEVPVAGPGPVASGAIVEPATSCDIVEPAMSCAIVEPATSCAVVEPATSVASVEQHL